MNGWPAIAGAFALVVAAAGCRAEPSREPLLVFAASSLTDVLTELEPTFESEHPEIDLVLAFAGSQALRFQIEQGARADVFASAAPEHMQALREAGLVSDSDMLARAALVVVVPREADSTLARFEDLPRAEQIVLGAPDVPIGRYTQDLLTRADAHFGGGFAERVRARVVSEEANVRLVLAKVELGEVDAAVVYRTDAQRSTRARAIELPPELATSAEYRIAVLAHAPRPEPARAFVELVRGPRGRAALARHGFEPERPAW